MKRFHDNENGGFYLSGTDNAELFMNPKEIYDGAVPSGNSVMAYDLVRLYQLTDSGGYGELAEKQLAFLSSRAGDYPAVHCMFLVAKMMFESPPEHITVALKSEDKPEEFKKPFLANIRIVTECAEYPLLNGKTTYYVCKDNSCLPPTNVYDR